jgi:cytochrome c-type biogenesis protein CcmF
MTAEIGHFALILALLVSLAQAAVPFIELRRRDPALAIFTDQAAFGAFVFVAIAFVCLTYAFVNPDFSVQVVAANSHTTKPLLYKIAAVWGNHEGSMLLWVLILTLFGAAVAVFGDNLMPGEQERVDALMHGRRMS